MSKLLDDLIKQSRDDASAYEEFLSQAETLVRQLAQKSPAAGIPASLRGNREAAVIFNNLATLPATSFVCPVDDDQKATLALQIDVAIRQQAPAGWKGDDTRERHVKNALFPLLNRDRDTTLALFEIIKSQPGY